MVAITTSQNTTNRAIETLILPYPIATENASTHADWYRQIFDNFGHHAPQNAALEIITNQIQTYTLNPDPLEPELRNIEMTMARSFPVSYQYVPAGESFFAWYLQQAERDVLQHTLDSNLNIQEDKAISYRERLNEISEYAWDLRTHILDSIVYPYNSRRVINLIIALNLGISPKEIIDYIDTYNRGQIDTGDKRTPFVQTITHALKAEKLYFSSIEEFD